MSVLNFPNRIVLELTPICNLSCFMCPRHIIGKNPGYMKPDLWYKLIDEIACLPKDIKVLPFWRGESLLHKKFSDLTHYALNKGINLHISTNGHYVDGEKAELLSQFEFITFSIHTDEGFNKAVEFARKYKNDDNTIQISFVDAEKDQNHFMESVLNASDLMGFDAVRLYHEHSIDGKFGHGHVIENTERIFCPKLENTIVIAFDGTISRCNHIWNTEDYNINDTSIKEAWDSIVMNEIRTSYPDEQCGQCDQWAGRTSGHFWNKEWDKGTYQVKKIY
ncbi:MAG: radical SAM protein [Gammaproteobacteria bacterium]|nr:radical SAM protein [Gammaproteobacteria bacterium]